MPRARTCRVCLEEIRDAGFTGQMQKDSFR